MRGKHEVFYGRKAGQLSSRGFKHAVRAFFVGLGSRLQSGWSHVQ